MWVQMVQDPRGGTPWEDTVTAVKVSSDCGDVRRMVHQSEFRDSLCSELNKWTWTQRAWCAPGFRLQSPQYSAVNPSHQMNTVISPPRQTADQRPSVGTDAVVFRPESKHQATNIWTFPSVKKHLHSRDLEDRVCVSSLLDWWNSAVVCLSSSRPSRACMTAVLMRTGSTLVPVLTLPKSSFPLVSSHLLCRFFLCCIVLYSSFHLQVYHFVLLWSGSSAGTVIQKSHFLFSVHKSKWTQHVAQQQYELSL